MMIFYDAILRVTHIEIRFSLRAMLLTALRQRYMMIYTRARPMLPADDEREN